ncbi:MAG: hypothetical protein II220_06590, partial [Spirochaetales bacterium]|nr:hypothetical protein [Spirochaetales bacterium]
MNKHDELVLKLIAEEMLEEDDEIFMKEVEEAKNDPAFANTEISRKRIEKAIYEELKKLKKNKKRKSKMFVRVASILLVLLLGFSATTLTVKGFREKVWAFITNVGNSTHSSIIPSNDDYNSALDSYEGKYIPGWIPEGYKITDVINKTDIKTIKIQNTLGSSISFSEHTKNYDELLNIHKENLNDYQRMELNGVEVLINKQNSIT